MCLQSIMLFFVICTVRRVYLFCKKLIGCQVLVLTQGMQLPIRGPVWDVRQKQDKLNGGVDISSSKTAVLLLERLTTDTAGAPGRTLEVLDLQLE